MSRMFLSVTKVWNVQTGCLHNCVYCWARSLAEGRLKDKPRYKEGFVPRFNPEEMSKRFKPGEFIFLSSMGDICFATDENFRDVLAHINKFPETQFLIQTKNPSWLHQWVFSSSVYIGTTIESNRPYSGTNAPSPALRYATLASHPHRLKFLSIEPVMDFDLDVMVRWAKNIKPAIIEIGADNHGYSLPEPPWEKVRELLKALRKICPDVKEKDGLERLRK